MRRLLILLFITVISYGQTDSTLRSRAQEIELPDFVITKLSSVELSTQNKETPDVISPLSLEVILPKIENNNLTLGNLSEPVKLPGKTLDSLTSYNFRIKGGFGLYKMPSAEIFLYNDINKRHNIYSQIFFEKRRAFTDKADDQNIKIGLGSSFVIKKFKQEPARFTIDGSFSGKNYQTFGAEDSSRSISHSEIAVRSDFENLLYKEFNLNVGGYFLYNELNLKGNSFFLVDPYLGLATDLNDFDLRVFAEPYFYKITKEESSLKGGIKLKGELNLLRLWYSMNARFKLLLQTGNEVDNLFIGGEVLFDIKVTDNVIFTPFFKRNLKQVTPGELWNKNPYLDTNNYKFRFEKENYNIGFNLAYSLTRKSQIEFSLSSGRTENKNVFTSTGRKGYFDIIYGDISSIESNLLFTVDEPEFGALNALIRYQKVTFTENNKKVPYTPDIFLSLNYRYKFDFSLLCGLRISYNNKMYSDSSNNFQVLSLTDLSLYGEYPLSNKVILGIEAENILNQENIKWLNYKGRPVDFMVYISMNF